MTQIIIGPFALVWHLVAGILLLAARFAAIVVGRILAIVNHAYNDIYTDHRGFFGFFESIDDVEVARALCRAARGWLA